MEVNTKHVAGRRHLTFNSYQDILDEVHRLAKGPTRQLGNWSLGQICDHLARAMDMAVDGPKQPAPLLIRWFAPLIKNRVLSQPMRPGFRLPKQMASLLPPAVDDAAGVAALEVAARRIQEATDLKPHAAFGRLTRDEWNRLQMKHAAMHLGFLVPQ